MRVEGAAVVSCVWCSSVSVSLSDRLRFGILGLDELDQSNRTAERNDKRKYAEGLNVKTRFAILGLNEVEQSNRNAERNDKRKYAEESDVKVVGRDERSQPDVEPNVSSSLSTSPVCKKSLPMVLTSIHTQEKLII